MTIWLLYSKCDTDCVKGWGFEGAALSSEDADLFVCDMHDLGRDAKVWETEASLCGPETEYLLPPEDAE